MFWDASECPLTQALQVTQVTSDPTIALGIHLNRSHQVVFLLGGHINILIVVDRLTKQALFILTIRALNATMLAELFVRHVFSKHRVLSYVTSNQETEFVSKFFRSLANALDMKLHFTSGYHPEADG